MISLKSIRHAAITIAAVAILIYSYATIRAAQGSYWMASNQDPSYPYLLNSLLIANAEAPQHIDHPGTTVQLLGAAVIRASNLGLSTDAINRAVLSDPESHLRRISASLFILIIVAAVLGAIIVARKDNASLVTLTYLLTPLAFAEVHKQLASVTPEPLLISVGLFSGAIHIARTRRAIEQGGYAPRYGWEDAALAALAGVGVITKVTYLPLCALAFLHLRTVKHFVAALAIAAGTAGLLLLPIFPEIPRMVTWFKNLALHTGHYGGGASGFIEPTQYRANILQLIRITPLLLVIWVATALYLAGTAYTRLRDSSTRSVWLSEFLLFVTGILGFLLTAKHPNAHYLIPTYIAGALLLPTLILGLKYQAPWRRWATAGVAFSLIAIGFESTRHTFLQFRHQLRDCTEIADELTRTLSTLSSKGRFVYYYRSSCPEFALHFGNGYSRRHFAPTLNEIYHGPLILNVFNGNFETYTQAFKPSAIYSELAPLVFVGSGTIDAMPAGITFEMPLGWKRTALLSKHLAQVDLFTPPEGPPPQTP